MSENQGTGDSASPDKFAQRDVDVSDLKVQIGIFDEKLQNLKDNMVTKEQFANSRMESA